MNKPNTSSFLSGLRQWASKNYIFLLSFFIPMILFAVAMAFNGVYPHSAKTILSSDLSNMFVDKLAYQRSILLGQHNFQYTWKVGLGNPLFLGDGVLVFTNLVLILFPQSNLTDAIYFIILLQIGFAGLTFSLFLSYIKRSLYIVLFSICYALCGYAVAMHWMLPIWTGFVWTPLVILGVEKLFEEKRALFFIVSLTLCMISSWYTAYFVCAFTVLYFVYKIALLIDGKNKKELFRTSGLFAFSSILAFCLAGFVLIPTIISMRNGNLYQDVTPLNFYFRYNIKQLLAKLFIGTYDTNGPGGVPFIYCGLLPLTMFVLSFFQHTTKREKLCGIAFSLIIFSTLTINPLYIAIHGFDAPSWFEGRFSFAISFFILFWGYKTLINFKNNSKSFNILYIASTLILIVTVLLVLENSDEMPISIKVVLANLFFLIAFCFVISISKSDLQRLVVFAGLFALTGLELGVNTVLLIRKHEFQERKESSAYNKYISDVKSIIEYIPESERNVFRIEKSFYRRETDAFAIGYNSVSGNTILNNPLNNFFIKNNSLRYTGKFSLYGNDNNAVLDSLLGIRYILSYRADKANPYSLYQNGAVKIYKNEHSLNIINTVNKGIRNVHINDKFENHYELENTLLKALSGGNNECFKRGVDDSYYIDIPIFETIFDKLKAYAPEYISFKDTKIKAKMRSDADFNYLWTSIPFSKGWRIKIDGEKVETIGFFEDAFIGARFPTEGEHLVELMYTAPGLMFGVILSVFALITLIVKEMASKKKQYLLGGDGN
ncbi:MAG: YfhO family protein [Treponema sp.]|jgi:uncharacterized membrane protein YfhO|nr:YfhO family protein [Treponema sp.]